MRLGPRLAAAPDALLSRFCPLWEYELTVGGWGSNDSYESRSPDPLTVSLIPAGVGAGIVATVDDETVSTDARTATSLGASL